MRALRGEDDLDESIRRQFEDVQPLGEACWSAREPTTGDSREVRRVPGGAARWALAAALLAFDDPCVTRLHRCLEAPDGLYLVSDPSVGETLEEWAGRTRADLTPE